MRSARGLLAFAGHDPYTRDEQALIGALRVHDGIDALMSIRNFLQNTAKNAQKAQAGRRKFVKPRRRR